MAARPAERFGAGGEEGERIVGERVRELSADAFPRDDAMVLYWRKNHD